MTPLSEYKHCQMAFSFYAKMELDRWYRIDEIALQQVSWGAKIDMNDEEKQLLIQVGKWIIDYGMLDTQRVELTFSDDYTRVKKTPWDIIPADTLYNRNKQKKNESVEK